jgi:anti-sigma factor RsiW
MTRQHISDEDLERYYLGKVTDESELAPLEEHLLACSLCVERAEEAQDRVNAIRAAIIEGGFDLE